MEGVLEPVFAALEREAATALVALARIFELNNRDAAFAAMVFTALVAEALADIELLAAVKGPDCGV